MKLVFIRAAYPRPNVVITNFSVEKSKSNQVGEEWAGWGQEKRGRLNLVFPQRNRSQGLTGSFEPRHSGVRRLHKSIVGVQRGENLSRGWRRDNNNNGDNAHTLLTVCSHRAQRGNCNPRPVTPTRVTVGSVRAARGNGQDKKMIENHGLQKVY